MTDPNLRLRLRAAYGWPCQVVPHLISETDVMPDISKRLVQLIDGRTRLVVTG